MINDETDFDIRRLIQQVRYDIKSPDPTLITNEVLRRLPPEFREIALRQVLRSFVRNIVGSPPPTSSSTDEPKSLGGTEHESGPVNGSPPAPVHSGRSSRMKKWREQGRQWRHAKLYGSTYVGEEHAEKRWKYLGDCNVADLGFVIDYRYEMANANVGKAQWFEKVRTAVLEHHVKTVGDLPDDVVENLFRDHKDDDEDLT